MAWSSRIFRAMLLAVYGLTSTVGVALHQLEHRHDHSHPIAALVAPAGTGPTAHAHSHADHGHPHQHVAAHEHGPPAKLTGEQVPAEFPLAPSHGHDHDCFVCHLLAAKVMVPALGASLDSQESLRPHVVVLDSRPIRRARLQPISRGPPAAVEIPSVA